MTTTSIKCPSKSIIYNTSRCACPTGQFLNSTTNSCSYFWGRSAIYTDTGVELDNSFGFSFPETIFSFDSIKKFTQSQAVFLEATLVMVASWLLFCFFSGLLSLNIMEPTTNGSVLGGGLVAWTFALLPGIGWMIERWL